MRTLIAELPEILVTDAKVVKDDRLRNRLDGRIGKVVRADYRKKMPEVELVYTTPEGKVFEVYSLHEVSRTLSTPQEDAFQMLLVVSMEWRRTQKGLANRIQNLIDDLRRKADDIERNNLARVQRLDQYDTFEDNPFGARTNDRFSFETAATLAQDTLHNFLWMIPNTHAYDLARLGAEVETLKTKGFFLYREYVANYGPLSPDQQTELDRYSKPVVGKEEVAS